MLNKAGNSERSQSTSLAPMFHVFFWFALTITYKQNSVEEQERLCITSRSMLYGHIVYLMYTSMYSLLGKTYDGRFMRDAHTWNLLTSIDSIRLLSFPYVMGSSMYNCKQQELHWINITPQDRNYYIPKSKKRALHFLPTSI